MEKHQKRLKLILITIAIILLMVAFINPLTNDSPVQAIEPEPYYEPIDRFGITIPSNTGVDQLIESINVRAVLDWRLENTTMNFPDNVEYIHVVRVSDSAWANGGVLTTLSTVVANNPGDVWIIGNEPDRKDVQDSVTPEVYANRYYSIASLIRETDPFAKIGFGSIVQPTPIRIRYLQRALDELIELSGNNKEVAMGLIDIWSIHAFILNEDNDVLNFWGADSPPGFDCSLGDCYDIFVIEGNELYKTHSIALFIERIESFRSWMNSIGEGEKPLWITEYGSLFPDLEIVCPSCSEYNGWPKEEDTKEYMISTFNYLLNASDPITGFSIDNNHLVQRWFWYSLNDYRYNFGGSLFDPENNYQITMAGEAFKNYTDFLIADKIYLPLVIK